MSDKEKLMIAKESVQCALILMHRALSEARSAELGTEVTKVLEKAEMDVSSAHYSIVNQLKKTYNV